MRLFECIKDDGYAAEMLQWINNFPVKGELYTLRSKVAVGSGQIGYLLEEITNPNQPNGYEPNFDSKRFVERKDGIDVGQLLHETNLTTV